MLKSIIVTINDYKALETVDESERLEAEKAGTIIQKLLASNQAMANQATGDSAQTRKVLGAS